MAQVTPDFQLPRPSRKNKKGGSAVAEEHYFRNFTAANYDPPTPGEEGKSAVAEEDTTGNKAYSRARRTPAVCSGGNASSQAVVREAGTEQPAVAGAQTDGTPASDHGGGDGCSSAASAWWWSTADWDGWQRGGRDSGADWWKRQ